MSCIRKNSVNVGKISRDELECMRDSPAYQMHSSAAGTSYSDDSPHSNYPAPNTYLTGPGNTPNRLNGRTPTSSSSPSATLLKTALANRFLNSPNATYQQKSPSSQRKFVNGRPPLAPQNGSVDNSQNDMEGWSRRRNEPTVDQMSTSILKNPARYRDSDGRTGIQLPKEWVNNKNVQQTEIKQRNSTSRSPTPERFVVRRTSSMETQKKIPQKYNKSLSPNGSPKVQPRSSSLFQRKQENGFANRSNTDYGVSGNSLLKNGLERRGSSQSVSSRGSLVPKSVTFCERVLVNEIARKSEDGDSDNEDTERCSVSPHDPPIHTGQLLQLPSLSNNDSISSDEPSQNPPLRPILPQLSRLMKNGGELRNSPSLNLDEIVFNSHRRCPDSLSEDEWRMIQSIYVPGKTDSQELGSPTRQIVDFKPISVEIDRETPNRSLQIRHSLSPPSRMISPNLDETRRIFQPERESRPTEKQRIFGQFSPPPRRKLQPNRGIFYSPTRQTSDTPFYDLRKANQIELENQMAEKQAMEANSILNNFRQFSVVPPNRSFSPNSNSGFRDLSPRGLSPRGLSPRGLSPRNCTKNLPNEIGSPTKIPSPRLLIKPQNLNTNGYEASDEMTPTQTARKQQTTPNVPTVNPSLVNKPPLPILKSTDTTMQQSFYDNVDLQEEEKKQQHKFVSRFGRAQQRTSLIPATRLDNQSTPPPSDPEQPKTFGSRKESSDSIFSNTSRESIMSATSIKADAKLRRNFNY